MKWVLKTRPEIFPANIIASSFAKTSSAHWRDEKPSIGQLLAVGSAVDAERPSEQRTQPVIAIPGGEAGHVLRLVRAQTEYQGWRKQSAVKLPMLHVSGDIGYWSGSGGTIRQITFSNGKDAPGALLAVRQDSVVTIFRPIYHKQRVRAVVPKGYDKQYLSSRLSANPVAVLKAEICGSRRHAHVSFNPFYTRQFGVVDDSGHWSIWDTEGRMRKNATLELVAGKSGRIYDDSVPSPGEKATQATDSWHRILWGSNVSTIVVCNRCHIAAFNIKGTPTRLPGPLSLSIRDNEWILDIKRSPTHPQNLFVLTTSRVFWINVIPDGGRDENQAGLRVILSYRHFRDVSDDTMTLTVLPEDDGTQSQMMPDTLLTS
jgi:RNA polymerase I-specific transcription initiation factor RRN6